MAEQGVSEAVEDLEDLLADFEIDAARDRLDEAKEEFGAERELLAAEAELLLEEEAWDDCVRLVERLVEDADDDERGRLLTLAGYAHFYADRIDRARTTFNEAVRAGGATFDVLLGRAIVHEYLDYLQAAMLDLDRIIELDDQEAQPFALRGSIHIRFGNVEEARKDLAHAFQLDPYDEETALNLARIHALNRSTSPAMEALEPLVEGGELAEFVAPGALLRSQLSLTFGSVDAALEDAAHATELLPDEPWGYLQTAACHIHANVDPGEAIAALKKAEARVDDRRDLPDLHALYAAAYDALGKPEKAKEHRDDTEGMARLPGYVYGPLNPAQNIPINPNKPIDIRALMDDLFGEAANAPDGYEDVLRQIVDQIPDIIEENPGVEQLHLELPDAPGMIGENRHLVISTGASNN